jgi:hypothetical protein
LHQHHHRLNNHLRFRQFSEVEYRTRTTAGGGYGVAILGEGNGSDVAGA